MKCIVRNQRLHDLLINLSTSLHLICLCIAFSGPPLKYYNPVALMYIISAVYGNGMLLSLHYSLFFRPSPEHCFKNISVHMKTQNTLCQLLSPACQTKFSRHSSRRTISFSKLPPNQRSEPDNVGSSNI